jgi:hypothetical protein
MDLSNFCVFLDFLIAVLGELPVLKDGQELIANFQTIIKYLTRRKEWNLNDGLTPVQLAQAYALQALVEGPLYDALVCFWLSKWTHTSLILTDTYIHCIHIALCLVFAGR